jgi:hypothetical protein
LPSLLREIKLIEKITRELAKAYFALELADPGVATAHHRESDNLIRWAIYRPNIGMLANLRKTKTRLSAEVDHHINTFTISSRCLSLVEDMHNMLPLELRSMIYKLLLQGSEVQILSTDLDKYASETQSRFSSKILQQCASLEYAHILLADDGIATLFPELMNTRWEFSQAWYQSTSFHIKNYNSLCSFLAIDRWGFDYNVSDLIRSMSITLKVSTSQYGSLVARQALVKQLKPVLKMRALARLKLMIQDSVGSGTPSTRTDFIQHLAAMFPSLVELSTAGCSITISLSGCSEFEVKKEELTVQNWVARK